MLFPVRGSTAAWMSIVVRASLGKASGLRYFSVSCPRFRTNHSSGKRWSNEETKILLQFHRKGCSVPEIAARLSDRSSIAVEKCISLLRRKGLIPPVQHRNGQNYTPFEDKTLKRLRSQGLTFPAIALHLPERTSQSLRARHMRLESARGRYALTSNEHILLQHLRNEERLTWPEIMAHMPGLSFRQLSSYYCKKTPLKDRVNVEPRNHYSKEILEEALCMRRQGKTYNEIATRLSIVSKAAVANLLRTAEFGMLKQIHSTPQRSKRRYSAEEDLKLMRLKAVPEAWSNIALHFPERSLKSLEYRLQILKERGKIVKGPSGKWILLDGI